MAERVINFKWLDQEHIRLMRYAVELAKTKGFEHAEQTLCELECKMIDEELNLLSETYQINDDTVSVLEMVERVGAESPLKDETVSTSYGDLPLFGIAELLTKLILPPASEIQNCPADLTWKKVYAVPLMKMQVALWQKSSDSSENKRLKRILLDKCSQQILDLYGDRIA
ncbi:hypothetical protein QJU93_07260 [Pasteurella skyensis]|uniref:Uncharacterized protein n=1 Tax=Phocoenobacter skyensis TaxID=97481 RepID=A0AAJ6NAC3_9PAST|nr:hypothetical protein [Pasteurella skyensis]MDP8173154.1 hypothetical protein [Pasteurella skyensis]MDP8178913.1 hypothetical protein [Pasteurella skyensis]